MGIWDILFGTWLVFPNEYSIRLMISRKQCWLSKVESIEAYKAKMNCRIGSVEYACCTTLAWFYLLSNWQKSEFITFFLYFNSSNVCRILAISRRDHCSTVNEHTKQKKKTTPQWPAAFILSCSQRSERNCITYHSKANAPARGERCPWKMTSQQLRCDAMDQLWIQFWIRRHGDIIESR